jgi:tetratricopeptide (TPR) repeat protein
MVVARAQEYLDSLAKESSRDDSLQSELANAYERLGDVQGGFQGVNLGDPRGAAVSYAKALAIREGMKNGEGSQRDLIRSNGKLSDLLFQEGKFDESLAHLRRSVEIAGKLAAAHPDNRVDQRNLAVSLLDYGYKQAVKGDWHTGLESLQRSLGVLVQLSQSDPSDRQVKRILALAYGREGGLLEHNARRFDAALEAHLKQTAILREMVAQDPGNSDLRRLLSWSLIGQGTVLRQLARYPAAIAVDQDAMGLFAELISKDAKDAQSHCDIGFAELGMAEAHWQLAKSHHTIADAQEARHRVQEAIQALRFGKAQGLLSPQDQDAPAEAVRLLTQIEAFR